MRSYGEIQNQYNILSLVGREKGGAIALESLEPRS